MRKVRTKRPKAAFRISGFAPAPDIEGYRWYSEYCPPKMGSVAIHVLATPVLPSDAESRKETPIFSGFLNYFPLAVAAVARMSKRGNDQHNPGEPLGWARAKSTDHLDCLMRHLVDVKTVDPMTGEYIHAAAVAWRAMAHLQTVEERRLGKPPSRASR